MFFKNNNFFVNLLPDNIYIECSIESLKLKRTDVIIFCYSLQRFYRKKWKVTRLSYSNTIRVIYLIIFQDCIIEIVFM